MRYIREQHSSESPWIFSTSVCNIGCACFHYQESISDFYWYYSGKDVMDEAGQLNFSKALAVAKQIFNSLTEYIQVMHIYSTPVHQRMLDFNGFLHFIILYFLFLGPLYRESAEFGTQQVVGCSGWVPACFCKHANETVTGNPSGHC